MRVAQSFPATARIMAELGQLLRSPQAALEDVAVHLKHDSALAARLLRIANSVAFAQRAPVSSIEDAAALIGFQEVHRLIGAVAVDHFSLCNYPLYGFTGRRLRENSLMVALLMEELAKPAGEDPPTAYSSGLFRSIGKLALAKLVNEAAPVAGFQPTDNLALLDWERQTFGLSSNKATAAILQQWHFPIEVSQSIGDHYDPGTHSHSLAHLLNHAVHLAEQLGYGLPGESTYWRDATGFFRTHAINLRDSQRIIERVVISFDRINRAIS
ncbi:MAG: HDOD domain-containing protein [Opitutae bacterium]